MSENTQVISPIFTAVFPNLFTPKPIKVGGKEKGDPLFGVTLLIDKPENLTPDDQARLKAMKEAAVKAAQAKWPGRDLKEVRMPFRNGNTEAAAAEKKGKNGDFFKDKIVVKANTKFKPQVVGPDRQEILNDKLVYSGCLMYAEVNLVAYEGVNGGDDGVKAYLGNFVMKVKDGDRLTGRSAADVFSGIGGVASDEDPTAGLDDEIAF